MSPVGRTLDPRLVCLPPAPTAFLPLADTSPPDQEAVGRDLERVGCTVTLRAGGVTAIVQRGN